MMMIPDNLKRHFYMFLQMNMVQRAIWKALLLFRSVNKVNLKNWFIDDGYIGFHYLFSISQLLNLEGR